MDENRMWTGRAEAMLGVPKPVLECDADMAAEASMFPRLLPALRSVIQRLSVVEGKSPSEELRLARGALEDAEALNKKLGPSGQI